VILLGNGLVQDIAGMLGEEISDARGMAWALANQDGAIVSSDPPVPADTFFSVSQGTLNLNDATYHTSCVPGVVFFDLSPADPETLRFSANDGADCPAPAGADAPPILARHISYAAFDCGL
jgi:hypothetical protein